jgi:hypothetical protein
MGKLRGWGLLLAICVPLLIFISWGQLGSTASRINLERYEATVGKSEAAFSQPLVEFFQSNRKIPVAGDVSAPPIPDKSGIKTWALQPNGIFAIELDVKIDGQAVVLQMVPLVRGNGLAYDCVSTTSALHVGKFCQPVYLQSVNEIAAELQANPAAIARLPAATTEANTGGAAMGSIVLLPAELDKVGLCSPGCIKPLSCANERPLLCSGTIVRPGLRLQGISATPTAHRGTDIATQTDANAICVKAFGAGHEIAQSGNLGAEYAAQPLAEYWVHNSRDSQSNCWRGP